MGLGGRELGPIHRDESSGQRQAGATRGNAGRRSQTRRGTGGGREAAGVQKGRSPQSSARASDAGKCPHPGNLQRSAAAATLSGRQNGGGDGGLVLRGEPGPRDPREGPRWPVAAPPASLPALPLRGYLGSLGGAPTASAPALRPAVAVQETRTLLQVGLGLASRVGLTLAIGARVGGAVAARTHARPRWRGSRGCCGLAGRPGPLRA